MGPTGITASWAIVLTIACLRVSTVTCPSQPAHKRAAAPRRASDQPTAVASFEYRST